MRLQQQLTRSLAEGLDLVLDGLLHDGVHAGLRVHGPLVGQVVEHVGGPHRLRPPLLVAEDEITPLVKLIR